MTPRIDLSHVSPGVLRALFGLERQVELAQTPELRDVLEEHVTLREKGEPRRQDDGEPERSERARDRDDDPDEPVVVAFRLADARERRDERPEQGEPDEAHERQDRLEDRERAGRFEHAELRWGRRRGEKRRSKTSDQD